MKYVRIDSESELPDISKLNPFRCIVVIEHKVSEERQYEISGWLVVGGCLYMMAWGKDCSSWDSSVDDANLEAFDFNYIPEEKFVMTTWHDNEPLEEVFWFSKHCAFHPEVDLQEFVLVHISSVDKESVFRERFQNA